VAGIVIGDILRLISSPISGVGSGNRVLGTLARRDLFDGGDCFIAGTVTVNTIPARRLVRLYDLRSGRLINSTWSAENGAYRFDYIKGGGLQYLVLAHDYEAIYNAVVADFVTPEVLA